MDNSVFVGTAQMRGIMLYFGGLMLVFAGYANSSVTLGLAGIYIFIAAFG